MLWAPLLVVLGPPPPISGGGQYEDSWDTHWTWEGGMAQTTWRGWARGKPDNATPELEGKRCKAMGPSMCSVERQDERCTSHLVFVLRALRHRVGAHAARWNARPHR